MSHTQITPAIFVKFTPYLIDWAEEQFSTSIILYDHPVLELRPLPGIREAMREPVDEVLDFAADNRTSLSQLHYAALIHSQVFVAPSPTGGDVSAFRPVSAPPYMQVKTGAIYPFSRIMQLRRPAASAINGAVYRAFWNSVNAYAVASRLKFATDKDMIESFCEEHHISSVHIDDLRNQYQRLKRKGYFLESANAC